MQRCLVSAVIERIGPGGLKIGDEIGEHGGLGWRKGLRIAVARDEDLDQAGDKSARRGLGGRGAAVRAGEAVDQAVVEEVVALRTKILFTAAKQATGQKLFQKSGRGGLPSEKLDQAQSQEFGALVGEGQDIFVQCRDNKAEEKEDEDRADGDIKNGGRKTARMEGFSRVIRAPSDNEICAADDAETAAGGEARGAFVQRNVWREEADGRGRKVEGVRGARFARLPAGAEIENAILWCPASAVDRHFHQGAPRGATIFSQARDGSAIEGGMFRGPQAGKLPAIHCDAHPFHGVIVRVHAAGGIAIVLRVAVGAVAVSAKAGDKYIAHDDVVADDLRGEWPVAVAAQYRAGCGRRIGGLAGGWRRFYRRCWCR